jgi:hypothetical protein
MFVLTTVNSEGNLAGDAFGALADSDGINSMGGEFLVNGTQTDGAAVIRLIDTDHLMFMSEAQAHILPTPTQLLHADFVTGGFGDERAPGVNHISFRNPVPEPSAILLAAQFLCVLLSRAPRLPSQTADRCGARLRGKYGSGRRIAYT